MLQYFFDFISCFFTDDHLLEVNESLRTKNLSLSVQLEKLKQENFDLQIKAAEGLVLIVIWNKCGSCRNFTSCLTK